MYKTNIAKRVLLMFLVAWITFISVFGAYQRTTECAELVTGIITAIAGAPMLTVLAMTGVVVAGGIAIYEISQTDAEDYRNFANSLKTGFTEFVSEQEKQIALEQDSSLSDQEASDIGVANARGYVNNLWDNAIDTTKSTATNLQYQAVRYWDLFSRIICSEADQPQTNTEITPTTPIKQTVRNYYNSVFNGTYQKQCVGADCSKIRVANTSFESSEWFQTYKNYWWVMKGDYVGVGTSTKSIDYSTGGTLTTVPFVYIEITDNGNSDESRKYNIHSQVERFNLSNKYEDYVSGTSDRVYSKSWEEVYNLALKCIIGTSLPVIICNTWGSPQNIINTFQQNPEIISVGENGTNEEISSYRRSIRNALDNTKIGNSIQTGRRQLVNTGDYVGSMFKTDSVPVQKSGVRVQDGVVTGSLGWDIPDAGVWDDVINGKRTYGDVVGKTGSVSVPTGALDDPQARDTEVDYPEDTPVQDTADYPEDAPDKPQEIPEKPQSEVFEEQGGSYYPNEIDLTHFFPFCIPFDIIYLVEKFDVQGANAPVITIPIVYPNAIRGVMGSDGYEVTIDFQDFIVVRNVLRAFLLILFIAGLMKITRDLIRG